ncbi:hypothetical protein [Cupriavidus sp. UME77]|uniref:hypothetical protein n=1 Tax=Cupriavidus sp. UME77 TaxID=1862321 RepID=UPI0016012DE8|nr:hypothetical protein [Cupriavidus sp. UME77]MBB1630256.1 hypothetical protein [Cupriavidus sp. UME77]
MFERSLKQDFMEIFSSKGEAWVRAHLEEGGWTAPQAAWAREYLHDCNLRRAEDVEEARRREAEKGLQISAASVAIARASAEASRRSAKWAMVAAGVTAFGIVVSAAQSLGWLEWAKHITK